jgi:CO/xanthine dehydrogenase Mo-binding subunit
VIGRNAPRADGRGKMEGTVRYAADVRYEGMLHAATVRAPLPHGQIRAIRRREDAGVDWSRVVFATADDIPGARHVRMIKADMPFLAWDEVLYRGEPVALVAAPTLQEAEAARRAVEVEMEPLPAILTLEELVQRHRARDAELFELSRWHIGHGDAAAALEGAEVVLEDCYTTPHQEHAYLEPNVMTAVPEAGGTMRVEGSLQCPYYVGPAVAGMLGTDLDRLHVVAFPMGGAFGGKEDFPSLLGGHAALLAHLSGKPVRLALDRAEDAAYSTKRHPSWVRIRAGARRDGTLCGVEVDIVFDGGAYATMSPVVLSRGAIHAAGAYRWPAVSIDAVAYRSHTPPNGAFRGFGVPQTIYAIECHVDRLARACGLSPHAFREKNRLRPGDLTATSQRLDETVASGEVLAATLEASRFAEKLERWGASKVQPAERVARGVGMALYWHGAGFTGAGEAKIAARVALDLADDGLAHIRVSSTEMGQGAHTVLSQIVAEELGLPASGVVCDPPDTGRVPDSGPTVASRTTMIVGGELQICARAARQRLLEAVARRSGRQVDELTIAEGVVRAGGEQLGAVAELIPQLLAGEQQPRWEFTSQHQLAPHIRWDEPTHTGDAYATYAWGCTVVEVEVDLDLFELRVPRVYVAADVGRAVNPTLAQGQIEGGTLQSLGYALTEEVGVRPDGGWLRDRFQTYILPTALDSPEFHTVLVEVPYPRGPGGAKGLGEMPMNGGAPAVANAIEHALGVRIRDLPILPEKLHAALADKDNNEVQR